MARAAKRGDTAPCLRGRKPGLFGILRPGDKRGQCHVVKSTPRRRGAAGAAPARARRPARAGHVCRGYRRSTHHRSRAQARSRAGRLPDFSRFVRVRLGDAHPVARRDAMVRHQAARHDGRYVCFGRPHGGDGQRQSRAGWRTDDLRRDHRRRCGRHPDRAAGQSNAAVLSAGGHRHHHRGYRRLADAHRHQLDIRQPGRSDRAEADRTGACRLAEVGDGTCRRARLRSFRRCRQTSCLRQACRTRPTRRCPAS